MLYEEYKDSDGTGQHIINNCLIHERKMKQPLTVPQFNYLSNSSIKDT